MAQYNADTDTHLKTTDHTSDLHYKNGMEKAREDIHKEVGTIGHGKGHEHDHDTGGGGSSTTTTTTATPTQTTQQKNEGALAKIWDSMKKGASVLGDTLKEIGTLGIAKTGTYNTADIEKVTGADKSYGEQFASLQKIISGDYTDASKTKAQETLSKLQGDYGAFRSQLQNTLDTRVSDMSKLQSGTSDVARRFGLDYGSQSIGTHTLSGDNAGQQFTSALSQLNTQEQGLQEQQGSINTQAQGVVNQYNTQLQTLATQNQQLANNWGIGTQDFDTTLTLNDDLQKAQGLVTTGQNVLGATRNNAQNVLNQYSGQITGVSEQANKLGQDWGVATGDLNTQLTLEGGLAGAQGSLQTAQQGLLSTQTQAQSVVDQTNANLQNGVEGIANINTEGGAYGQAISSQLENVDTSGIDTSLTLKDNLGYATTQESALNTLENMAEQNYGQTKAEVRQNIAENEQKAQVAVSGKDGLITREDGSVVDPAHGVTFTKEEADQLGLGIGKAQYLGTDELSDQIGKTTRELQQLGWDRYQNPNAYGTTTITNPHPVLNGITTALGLNRMPEGETARYTYKPVKGEGVFGDVKNALTNTYNTLAHPVDTIYDNFNDPTDPDEVIDYIHDLADGAGPLGILSGAKKGQGWLHTTLQSIHAVVGAGVGVAKLATGVIVGAELMGVGGTIGTIGAALGAVTAAGGAQAIGNAVSEVFPAEYHTYSGGKEIDNWSGTRGPDGQLNEFGLMVDPTSPYRNVKTDSKPDHDRTPEPTTTTPKTEPTPVVEPVVPLKKVSMGASGGSSYQKMLFNRYRNTQIQGDDDDLNSFNDYIKRGN